ncbi:hypothetical protein N5079_23315 [Planotetraspora sp. A-T 1434]|uniref:beta-ketoacyl synthase N-terminal-like domain-containing protein n=1 Tax=Planotetraspora sp. A-T 1434 TaxID=2979219 RepID=UPI0021C0AD6C|nr:beta-ketoacyl synthase N-terminal-like domain-containing protein [Planotetraspora sp. A-T 1434]MCT9933143.1 hypothetical protein [Planotetraspora sp. A-T 1434]
MMITGRAVLAPAGDADATPLYDDLPAHSAPVLAGFSVRERLGRKGTSTFDRATALAVVACGEALRDAGVDLTTVDPARVGLVLGTTVGSLASTMDFSRETLVQDKPYLVNPMQFPNTVMNCAAGQSAIWYGLRGVNATVAGGPIAFLQAMRYAVRAIEKSQADTVLVGAVEEFTPHTAWSSALSGTVAAGEAATVFVLRRAVTGMAEVLATAAGFTPADGPGALPGCVRRALAQAGASPEQVWAMATGDHLDDGEAGAVEAALGRRPLDLSPRARYGDCGAAAGGLALAAVLDRRADAPADAVAVVTGRARDGAVAAAVIRTVPE